MKTRQRRSFSADMKARIALEAIKGQKSIQEIASHYGVHPNQVTNWKRQAVQGVPSLFADRRSDTQGSCRIYTSIRQPLTALTQPAHAGLQRQTAPFEF